MDGDVGRMAVTEEPREGKGSHLLLTLDACSASCAGAAGVGGCGSLGWWPGALLEEAAPCGGRSQVCASWRY